MQSKALLVGINKYLLPDADLAGCVNDVTNVRDVLLKYFAFTAKSVRVVTDGRATRSRILDSLEWLVRNASAGDRLLFHFSGHGSQVADVDGDEVKDHQDEILCPHDMDWDGCYISDDDMAGILDKVPTGVNLEVLLDSCHSGTGTREMHGLSLLPEEMRIRQRFLAPPVDVACRMDEDMETVRLLRVNNPMKHVLFTGCRDNQTSADAWIGGTYNGAFTYYFCKHIRDANGDISRGELIKRVRASLKFNGYSQVPQLECATGERGKKVLE
ncbi:MAG: hypothetical protein BWK76_05885 [Desulfobulbaceae bacterium A2]|nr:MAG: hypothetical protein BWK76_05885 [Desulfobulbaceae bacterium A2]